MDMVTEELSSPLQGFKYVKPFSNFFQATKQRFANLDPDSGVHMVGPMFELTACIDKGKGGLDFDADYPEASISYGPSICSFGLSYNDHNYALPVGLTPPEMAPHLMDINYPKPKPSILTVPMEISKLTPSGADSNAKEGSSDSNPLSSARCLIKTKGLKSQPCTTTTHLSSAVISVNPLVIASVADSTAGLSDSKKTLFAAWHAKAAASGGTLPVQARWKIPESVQQQTTEDTSQRTSETDQSSAAPVQSGTNDAKESYGERVYLEHDMKVIEVPEDICVSPSKLSSLDSSEDDDSDLEGSSDQTQERSVIESALKPATWSTVHCLCEVKIGDSRMLQCLNCRFLQHLDCMEIVYANGACTDEANPSNVTPKDQLLDPCSYLCPSCLHPTFTVLPDVLERVIAAQKQRESAKQHKLRSYMHHHTGKSEALAKQTFPIGGAQLLASATDRARSLGLIGPNTTGTGGGGGSITSSASRSSITFPNTDERHKLNCLERQNNETTDVNRRIPSPPRASKRKQDLTTATFDADAVLASNKSGNSGGGLIAEGISVSEDSVASREAIPSTPKKTDPDLQLVHHHNMQIYTAEGGTSLSSPIAARGSGGQANNVASTSQEGTPLNSPLNPPSSARKRRLTNIDSPQRLSTSKRGSNVASTLGSAWAKDYLEADISTYSENLLHFIQQRIATGRERVQRLPPTSLGRTPLCRVVMFDHNDKGLEASARLGKGEVVTELRGSLMLLEEYEHYVDPINEYNRYVLIYHNFGDRPIAINTSQYGNDARFVRRSCIPNCFLDHYLVNNKLRIILRTTQELMPGVELTIPFEFDYRSCQVTVKCACARSRCPVQKWSRKLARNKVMPYLDYGKFIETRLNDLSKPITEEQSPTTPNSRTYSSESSPVPLSAQKSIVPSGLASPGGPLTGAEYRAGVSKRPFPSARLFVSSSTPSVRDNNVVAPVASAMTTTSVATYSNSAQEDTDAKDTSATMTNPSDDNQVVESPKKRSAGSTEKEETTPSIEKGDSDGRPPFEPIIRTRRQSAKAAGIPPTKSTMNTRKRG